MVPGRRESWNKVWYKQHEDYFQPKHKISRNMKLVFKSLIHIIWWKPIQFCKLYFILISCCTLCQYLTLVWLHLSTCRSWFLVYEGSSELKGYIIWHRRFFNQFYVPLPRSGKMVSGRSRHGKRQQIYTSNVCAKIILT